MARPKSPEKLLELAIAAGDLEAAKAAMAKMKEKPKVKKLVKASSKKELKGAVLLNISDPDDQFKVQETESKNAKSVKLKIGVKTNTFKPGNLLLEVAKEDKKALKGKQPATRSRKARTDLGRITVTCVECNKKYDAEQWDVNRKFYDPDLKENIEMENLCTRCLKK